MGCFKLFCTGLALLVLISVTLSDLIGQTQFRDNGYGLPKDASAATGKQLAKLMRIHHSRNWSGAINSEPPSGRFAATKMKFTLPARLGPDAVRGPTNYYAASVWVGIDGYSHHTALLQAGVSIEVNKTVSEELVFRPWYEWWPKEAMFLDIPMGPGDGIEVEIVMFNATSGKVFMENKAQGEWVSRKLMAPRPDAGLAGQTVEWILEDFKLARGSNVPFGDFGIMELRDCVAYTTADDEVGPDSSQPFWIHQNNVTRARSAVNGRTITIDYNRNV